MREGRTGISLTKGDPSLEKVFHNLSKVFAPNLMEGPSLLTFV